MGKMRRTKKTILCLAAGTLLGSVGSVTGLPAAGEGVGCFQAYAATDKSVIDSINITFSTTYGDAEEIPQPTVTLSGSNITLGDVYYRTEYEKWKPGKKVRGDISVDAAEGKYMPTSLGRSKCKVSGAEFISAKALDDTSMQVKVDYTPVTVLGTTAEAGWSSSSPGKAVWKKVDNAPGYTLVLYGNDKVVTRLSVTENHANLGEYMTDSDKIYYYEVKAVPITSEQKKYLKEGEFVTSREQEIDETDLDTDTSSSTQTSTASSSGSTGAASNGGPASDLAVAGSLKGDNFVMPDGTLAVNTWKLVDGIWYYFDAAGNRARGWLNYGGKWYYFDGNGCMQTGWVYPGDGSWYYQGPDGDMQTGWIQLAGTWYYLGADGRMQTGWLLYNDNWYYLKSDGSMMVNYMQDGWYIGSDGIGRKGR